MPFKGDLSITIITRNDKKITFTPRDPLPPESRFRPPPVSILAVSAVPKTRKLSLLQCLKMFLKTKAKKLHRRTRVLSTGNNNEPLNEPTPPTIMRRFKNLWPSIPKRVVDPQIGASSRGERPTARGRQSSWMVACRGCLAERSSRVPHDPTVCASSEQAVPSDASRFFGPRSGSISHNLIDEVSTQRIHKANDRAEDLISRSIIRSPAMIPVFKDDIRACSSSEHQQDGNVGVPSKGVAHITTRSQESLVDVSFDGLYHHSPDIRVRNSSLDTNISSSSVTEIFKMEDLDAGEVSHLNSSKERDKVPMNPSSQTSKPNHANGHSTSTDILLDNIIPDELITELELPPSVHPLLTRQSCDIPGDLSDAMRSNITMKGRPISGSSVYSSPPSSLVFNSRHFDHSEVPTDSLQAYLDAEWPILPRMRSFSIDRGREPATDKSDALESVGSGSLPRPSSRSRKFSIERGHLKADPPSESTTNLVHTKALQIPSKRNSTEPDITEPQILSVGSSFMDTSHPPTQNSQECRQELDASETSAEFNLVSSVDMLPAFGKKKRSGGSWMPGRYPSVSSTYSTQSRRDNEESFCFE